MLVVSVSGGQMMFNELKKARMECDWMLKMSGRFSSELASFFYFFVFYGSNRNQPVCIMPLKRPLTGGGVGGDDRWESAQYLMEFIKKLERNLRKKDI